VAGTFTIPLTTLPDGVRTFGPVNVADADTEAVLTVDRTPAGGLNSLTAATSIALQVEQSNDGGTSWFLAVGGMIIGGQFFNTGPRGDGSLITQGSVSVPAYPGTGRQARVRMTVTGGSFAIAATLTIS